MATAKVFRHGSRQMVELPPDIQFEADEVDIRRNGDEVVLAGEIKEDENPPGLRFIEFIQSLPDDMFENIRDTRPPERREEF